MSSGERLAALILIDANAAIDFIRECALHYLGRPPTGRRAEVLRIRLGQEHNVIIAGTAAREAKRNMKKDIARKLGNSESDVVIELALDLLQEYLEKTEREDEIEHVPAAKKMYASIMSDPNNQKLIKWKEKKGAFKNNPVLGSDISDLKILSTAAHYARLYVVEFWTHDMDFTIFADEILMVFGLVVVDTYRLD